MRKYTVIKSLELRFECEATSRGDAENQCIDADELEMALVDCQYDVQEVQHVDTALSIEGLRQKYHAAPGGHPDFPIVSWMAEVTALNTLRSYWDWVMAQIEEHNDEAEDEDDE